MGRGGGSVGHNNGRGRRDSTVAETTRCGTHDSFTMDVPGVKCPPSAAPDGAQKSANISSRRLPPPQNRQGGGAVDSDASAVGGKKK